MNSIRLWYIKGSKMKRNRNRNGILLCGHRQTFAVKNKGLTVLLRYRLFFVIMGETAD